MKTIGNIIHNKTFPIYINNSNGVLSYCEYGNGSWTFRQFDDNGNEINFEWNLPEPAIQLYREYSDRYKENMRQ